MMELIIPLNSYLGKGTETTYWPLLLQMTGLNLSNLPKALPWRAALALPTAFRNGEFEVEYNDVSILQSLKLEKNARTRSIHVKTINAMADDQAQLKPGVRVLGINDRSIEQLTIDEMEKLIAQLPLPIAFRYTEVSDTLIARKSCRILQVLYSEPGPLGIKLQPRPLVESGAIVSGFNPLENGSSNAAEKKGVQPGQLLIRVNETSVLDLPFDTILSILRQCPRPMILRFTNNSDGVISVPRWPPDITLEICDFGPRIEQLSISPYPKILSGKLPQLGDELFAINNKKISTLNLFSVESLNNYIQELLDTTGTHILLTLGDKDYKNEALFYSRQVLLVQFSKSKVSHIPASVAYLTVH